jgi:hypothetical protein
MTTTAMAGTSAVAAAAAWGQLKGDAAATPSIKKRPLQLETPVASAVTAGGSGTNGSTGKPVSFAPLRRHSLLFQLNKHHKPSCAGGLGSPAAYDTDSEDEEEEEEEIEDEEEDGQQQEAQDHRLPFKKRRCHSTLHDSEEEEAEAEAEGGAVVTKKMKPMAALADRYHQQQPPPIRCAQSETQTPLSAAPQQE